MTIELGLSALTGAMFPGSVHPDVREMISGSKFRETAFQGKAKFDVYILTTAQIIGNRKGATIDELIARVESLGFEHYSDVAPNLRLQFQEQAEGSVAIAVMKPIPDLIGVENHHGELWLNVFPGDPEIVWPPDTQWIVVRRHKNGNPWPAWVCDL